MQIRKKSEIVLKSMLDNANKDARKMTFSRSTDLTTEVAQYLQSIGVIEINVYANSTFQARLTSFAFKYFQEKHDRYWSRFWFSLVIPIVVSILGTTFTLSITYLIAGKLV